MNKQSFDQYIDAFGKLDNQFISGLFVDEQDISVSLFFTDKYNVESLSEFCSACIQKSFINDCEEEYSEFLSDIDPVKKSFDGIRQNVVGWLSVVSEGETIRTMKKKLLSKKIMNCWLLCADDEFICLAVDNETEYLLLLVL